MGPEDLAQVLRPFAVSQQPDLLVGLHTADDAAVYRLNDEQAVVQTLDFFPPIVDDPYTFGAITAANAMSDVYAMGGRPLFALNLAVWPSDLPLDMLARIFDGGRDKVEEAGAVVAGGHTVSDEGPKYGLCVTGIVHPQRVATKGGARPDDVLVLTKPLGTGVVTTALKAGRAVEEHVEAAVSSMLRLNRVASEIAMQSGATAMTDVTGFGLLGHAYEMAAAGGVEFRIRLGALPQLPGALGYIEQKITPGGLGRNRDYLAGEVDGVPRCRWEGAPSDLLALACDPQTSGGLLISLPEAELPGLLSRAEAQNQPVWVIGEVVEAAAGTVRAE